MHDDAIALKITEMAGQLLPNVLKQNTIANQGIGAAAAEEERGYRPGLAPEDFQDDDGCVSV